MMRRLLAAMLAAGTIAMSILQPAHAQTNAPTDTHSLSAVELLQYGGGTVSLTTLQSLNRGTS